MFVYGDVVILKIGLGGIDPEKHSIEPPSYASTAYIIASYGLRFFSTVS